jgi:outer membrane protein assembly factor BamB
MVVADIHGVRQYIQTSAVVVGKIRGELSGVDTKGKLLWTQTIYLNENEGPATSPIVNGNQVFVTVGWGAGCHLFDINANQQATDLYNKKKTKTVKNTHGGVVLIDGYIYGHSERELWICQDLKAGEVKWEENRDLSASSGAITAAEDKLYLLSEKGEIGLVDATPKEFNLVSSFKLPKQSTIPKVRTTSRSAKVWAYPVIANGHLYVRDHEYIFAFKITK